MLNHPCKIPLIFLKNYNKVFTLGKFLLYLLKTDTPHLFIKFSKIAAFSNVLVKLFLKLIKNNVPTHNISRYTYLMYQ